MQQVKSVQIILAGDKNYPLAEATFRHQDVEDLHLLVNGAQAGDPSSDPRDVLRAVLRYGARELRKQLATGHRLYQLLPNLPKAVDPIPYRRAPSDNLVGSASVSLNTTASIDGVQTVKIPEKPASDGDTVPAAALTGD